MSKIEAKLTTDLEGKRSSVKLIDTEKSQNRKSHEH